MTDSATHVRLQRLGSGEAIDAICAADGLTRVGFDRWWAAECERRLPRLDGVAGLPVHAEVQILRDERGVPHVFAGTDRDLFVGYGFAMAQDRLFQMDLRRRRATGRLAEILGESALEADVLARTMDLPRLAAAEFERLPAETVALFEAFAHGVNAAIDDATEEDALAIEFALLDYAPEPWTALDCVRCAASWRWQLTGRPWVISVPEVARRTLGAGPLYDAFISFQRGESDDLSIVAAGESTARQAGLTPLETVAVPRTAGVGGGMWQGRVPAGVGATSADASSGAGAAAGAGVTGSGAGAAAGAGVTGSGAADPMGGSNNWVVGGPRSRSGKPILASDPHMPYEAASSFYEIHLSGGSFECAGAGFVGYPGLTFGRNRHLAWGITNNICSQRDLYIERDPGAVTDERVEQIDVRGRAEPYELAVKSTDRGPIVDRLLPATANPSGPVAMRWVGQLACDWPSAQLRLDRAETIDDAMTAVRGWLSPTFSLMIADDQGPDGHIAFTNTGTIPVRGRVERAYRDSAEPADAWQGLIPPEGMPQTRDPSADWIGSANNRPAPDDFPYPLSGTWDEGLRHRRISQLAEELAPHDRSTFSRMHTDVHVGRADDRVPSAVTALDGTFDGIEGEALDILREWNHDARADSGGAAVWEVFWTRWVQAVSAARFPRESSDFLAGWLNGFAGRLITGDEMGWFPSDEVRRSTLLGAFREAVGELTVALGDQPRAWRWGALHHKGLHHPLSAVGDLAELLDQPAYSTGGEIAVLSNSGFAGGRTAADDPRYARNWEGASGAGYRLVADLGDPNGSAWTVTLEGQSANAGSPNRSDQIEDFLAGRYHEIPLDRARAEAAAVHRVTGEPRSRHD